MDQTNAARNARFVLACRELHGLALKFLKHMPPEDVAAAFVQTSARIVVAHSDAGDSGKFRPVHEGRRRNAGGNS